MDNVGRMWRFEQEIGALFGHRLDNRAFLAEHNNSLLALTRKKKLFFRLLRIADALPKKVCKDERKVLTGLLD